jgi:misacylated tRNA(Ala) deacylase
MERIYNTDFYVKDFDAIVTAVDGKEIELDRTAFYPGGGGQQCDVGTLAFGGRQISIMETRKGDCGRILHVSDSDSGLSAGEKVHCSIDWSRRYGMMRHHTALHVIDGIVEKSYGGLMTGSQIYPDRARMDLDIPNLDRTKAEEIVREAQKVIDQDHKVVMKVLTMEEARKIDGLARTRPGIELMKKLTEARVVEIEGFDMQLDGGTHVANTSEIGRIEFAGYESRGSHNKRVEIRLA